MAIPSAAATYVYEYFEGGRGFLTFDATADVRLPLLKGADFDLKFVFNGPNLCGDNPVYIPLTAEFESRIYFSRRPELDFGGNPESKKVGLPIGNLLDSSFTTWTSRHSRTIGIIDWNPYMLVHDYVISDFLSGWSFDAPPRSSTYRITVSAIPIPATGALLLSGLVGFATIRLRKKKFRHQ